MVATVSYQTNVISDAGFGTGLKIYPEIRSPYAFLTLFWGDTGFVNYHLKILGLNPIFSFFSVKQGFWARIRNQRQKSAEPSARIFSCIKVLVSLEIHHLKMDSEGWIDSVSKFFRGGEAGGEAGFIQSVDCS